MKRQIPLQIVLVLLLSSVSLAGEPYNPRRWQGLDAPRQEEVERYRIKLEKQADDARTDLAVSLWTASSKAQKACDVTGNEKICQLANDLFVVATKVVGK
jgi:hypothetical protein